MEYRRRKRRRRRTDAVSGGAKVVAALLFAGVVIYCIAASPAADWLAGNLVAPAFSAISSVLKPAPDGGQESVQPPAQTAAQPAAAEAPAAEVQTKEIRPPAMTLYALQMGVYASRDNADAQADSLQARGAAGFIMEDMGKYRVLAAAYPEEASLQNVRAQLQTEGMESASYVMETRQPVLKVTASAAQTEGLGAAFTALFDAQKALGEAALRFDGESQSTDAGRANAKTIGDALAAAHLAFSDMARSDNTVIAQVERCFSDCLSQVDALAGGAAQSTVEFSSQIKYTHLYVAHAYMGLMNSISAQ